MYFNLFNIIHYFLYLDELTESELHMSKGFLAGICLIVLVVGLVVGSVLTLLLCRMQRLKKKTSKDMYICQ